MLTPGFMNSVYTEQHLIVLTVFLRSGSQTFSISLSPTKVNEFLGFSCSVFNVHEGDFWGRGGGVCTCLRLGAY